MFWTFKLLILRNIFVCSGRFRPICLWPSRRHGWSCSPTAVSSWWDWSAWSPARPALCASRAAPFHSPPSPPSPSSSPLSSTPEGNLTEEKLLSITITMTMAVNIAVVAIRMPIPGRQPGREKRKIETSRRAKKRRWQHAWFVSPTSLIHTTFIC